MKFRFFILLFIGLLLGVQDKSARQILGMPLLPVVRENDDVKGRLHRLSNFRHDGFIATAGPHPLAGIGVTVGTELAFEVGGRPLLPTPDR